MMLQLLKIMWKSKRRNALLLLEIAISFVVLVVVISLVIERFGNYWEPIGFDYKGVASAEMVSEGLSTDETRQELIRIKKALQMVPGVKAVTATANAVPFDGELFYANFAYNHEARKVLKWNADRDFATVMKISLVEGKWFDQTNDASLHPPIVINTVLAREFFGKKSPIGKVVEVESEERLVVGVVDAYREFIFQAGQPGFFSRNLLEEGNAVLATHFLIKYDQGQDFVLLDEKIRQQVFSAVSAQYWKIDELRQLETALKYEIADAKGGITTSAVVSCFLIFNISLGLFGAQWHSIQRRRSEIGIRRAVGSRGVQIQTQFLIEGLILSTLGIIPGLVFAVQFPLLNVFNVNTSNYLVGMTCAAAFIYLITLLSTFLPSKHASGILPALVLREE